MKVRLTAKALADLDEIVDWIGQDDWDRAEAFAEALRRKCAGLSRYSRRHPVVTQIRMEGVRKLAWRGYLIFYHVQAGGVEVLRIVHGSREWATLLDNPG